MLATGIVLLAFITGAPARAPVRETIIGPAGPAQPNYGPACLVWGDVHVNTFDGHKSIDYQGECTHTLARRCCATCEAIREEEDSLIIINKEERPIMKKKKNRPIAIPSCELIDFHVMNRPRTEGQGWPTCPPATVVHDIIIDICGYTIVLSNNPFSYKVTARTIPQFLCTSNPSPCNLPCAGSTMTIEYLTSEPQGVRFTSPQLRVTLSTVHVYSATVELYVGYKKKTCGVCGNFDGNPVNDLVTRGGINMNGKPDVGCPNSWIWSWRDNEIGNSWTMYDPKIPNCTNPVIPYPTGVGRKKRQAQGVCREDAVAIREYVDRLGRKDKRRKDKRRKDKQLAIALAHCEHMCELDVQAVPELRESMLCSGIMCASQAIARASPEPDKRAADIIMERYKSRGCIN